MKTLIIILSGIITLLGIGCAAMSSYITPATVDRKAVEYAIKAGIVDPNDYRGWQNLEKAERLSGDVDSAHTMVQWELSNLMEGDNLAYSRHKDISTVNVAIGRQREEQLFGETGLLSLGLSLAGFGTLTGYIGLMRKRPQDVTKEEMEKTIADIQGKSEAELTERERQFAQLVKGIQVFIDTYKTEPVVQSLKDNLRAAQDKETEAAVAVVKTTLS